MSVSKWAIVFLVIFALLILLVPYNKGRIP
jgi:hypothetical protein